MITVIYFWKIERSGIPFALWVAVKAKLLHHQMQTQLAGVV